MRLVLPLLTLALVGCVQDVSTGKVEAQIIDTPAAAAVQKADRTVPVDTARSRVHALSAKVTATHPIVFDDWKGELKLAGDEVVGVDVAIQMSSLRADVGRLTMHLKTPDFFDVQTFPAATFTSTQVAKQAGPDGATHLVTGDLTMRNKTQRISFPARIAKKQGTLAAHAEFALNRQDFGISYPGRKDDLIQDKVVLTVDLVAEAPDRG